MSHDPDHTHFPTPHYIQDCLTGERALLSRDTLQHHLFAVLVSASDRGPVGAALAALPALIKAEPPDLSEVCVEMAKVLLHLQDNWDLDAFSSLRHSALIALTTRRPRLLAPFLTTQFYCPNHNTRQRLDILEVPHHTPSLHLCDSCLPLQVLSSAATELSTPSNVTTDTQSPLTPHTYTQSKKPWQQLIDERVRAKTRMISKVPPFCHFYTRTRAHFLLQGPKKLPSSPTPSKFSPVAPLFFFPLMASYDQFLPTLDLLGRDSMLLGHLVQTLGNVLWCASHSPSQPAMACALLEFVWALRYHPSR